MTEAKPSLADFWDAQAAWSQDTFGRDDQKGPIGILKHLAKEAVEAQKKPGDLMEYVDCQFLVFEACRRAGFTYEQLVEGVWRKLEINKGRTWPKPRFDDEPVEHVREAT